ncbi:MAG: RING finger protein, partial [Promethearchaeota archaeon]
LVANSRYEEASVVPQGLSQFLDRITWVDVDEIMEFRLGRLRLVLELYELLRLDHLVELLRFPNTEALDIWLENIPDSVPLEIRGGEVIAHSSDIPDEVEQFFKVGRVLMELEPTTGEGESVDREHDPGVGVVYRRKLHEQSIFQLTKDALASYGIGRWRHAAIEGWTVIEALLSAEFERHYQRPKPIEMPYTKVIRHLRAHLPWDKFSEGMLLKSLKVRERIYPASPDPKPEEAEKIIAVALQLCQHLDVGLDELTPTGVSLLRVAATKPCPICIKPMRAGQRTARCPNCGEYYHLEHLMDYVKAKGYCPLCLKPLVIRRGGIEML